MVKILSNSKEMLYFSTSLVPSLLTGEKTFGVSCQILHKKRCHVSHPVQFSLISRHVSLILSAIVGANNYFLELAAVSWKRQDYDLI